MKARGVQFEGEPQQMNRGTFAQFFDEDGYRYVLKKQ
jgi:lactoylglutathione lyase